MVRPHRPRCDAIAAGETRPTGGDGDWVCAGACPELCSHRLRQRSSGFPLGVTWMKGFSAPGTPAKYDKVGVIRIGPSNAKNVLVLEPGTSAGSAYFVPLARWIVSKTSGWQVWSVERRENLLEDQSELNLAKEGKATATQLFDYYLGYLKDPSITHHFQSIPTSSVEFAKQWGMNVAVQDLHIVINAAKRLGGKVVLGGHSLGGSVVTAYATWDFNGKAGADALARPRLHRRWQCSERGQRPAGHPDTAGPRRAERYPLAGFRRDRRTLCRIVQCNGISGCGALSQPAIAGPDVGIAPFRHRAGGQGHQPRTVRLRPQCLDFSPKSAGSASTSRSRADGKRPDSMAGMVQAR